MSLDTILENSIALDNQKNSKMLRVKCFVVQM